MSRLSPTKMLWVVGISTLASVVHADTVAWISDVNAARQQAQATGKIVLVNIHATWCMPCKKLQATTLADPVLAKEINQYCVPVSLDADQHAAQVQQWSISGYPTQLFIAPDGQILHTIVGYVSTANYRAGLQKAITAAGVSVASNTSKKASPSPTPGTPSPATPPGAAVTQGESVKRPNAMDGFPPPAPPKSRDMMASAAPPTAPPTTFTPPPPVSPNAKPPIPPANQVVSQPTVADRTGEPAIDKDIRPCDMSMPLAFEGYCPVSMLRRAELIKGSDAHCCVYKNKRYQFLSAEDERLFTQYPKRYLPSEEGLCVVSWAENHARATGSIEFPALFRDYLYLFANDDARQKFLRDPERYVDAQGHAHRIPAQAYKGEPPKTR